MQLMDRPIIITLICERGTQAHTTESCFHEQYLAENHKFALFPSACLTLSTQHDLLHPPGIICVAMCLLQNTMRTTTARSRKTTKPAIFKPGPVCLSDFVNPLRALAGVAVVAISPQSTSFPGN